MKHSIKKALNSEINHANLDAVHRPVKFYAKMYWSVSSTVLRSSDWSGNYDEITGTYINPQGYKSWISNVEKCKVLEFYYTKHCEPYLIVEFTEDHVFTTDAGGKAIGEYDAYMMDPSTSENVFLFHHVVSNRVQEN